MRNTHENTFTAIDFELATPEHHSACAVGLTKVYRGAIIDTYYSLIQPPQNTYWDRFTEVHGITSHMTIHSPTFNELFPVLQSKIAGQLLVAHNAPFDRDVLLKTAAHYQINSNALKIPAWECTLAIYRNKGFRPCRLSDCCQRMGISLNHHHAASDSLACALLYLKR
ncbi:MAG: DNA polymerase III subunit epsilon [Deltaproteobacteria bacterium]|nr:DNA polymerase III subunit epsilon [Deltaproteobacteria bacterium]